MVFVLWQLVPGAVVHVVGLRVWLPSFLGFSRMVAVSGGDMMAFSLGKPPGAGGKEWWKAEELLHSDLFPVTS